MYLVGARGQSAPDHDLLTFAGTITAGGTAQILLPQQPQRAYLLIQNISAGNLFIGIGPATAIATITSNKVASVAVVNGGLGYTVPPQVRFLGGTTVGDFTTNHEKLFGFKLAQARATISAGAVSAITVSDGGAGYQVAPYVLLTNPAPDLGGGAIVPSLTAGIQLLPGNAVIFDNSFCPTSAVNIFGATTSQAFECKVGI